MKIVDKRSRNYDSISNLKGGQFFLWGSSGLYQKMRAQDLNNNQTVLAYCLESGQVKSLGLNQQVEPLQEVEFHVK